MSVVENIRTAAFFLFDNSKDSGGGIYRSRWLGNQTTASTKKGTPTKAEILIELQNLFLKNIEPVRPGRHPPRPKPKRKRGKYQTFTNYRRAI